jgi:thiamine biosynthesis lipoprotein
LSGKTFIILLMSAAVISCTSKPLSVNSTRISLGTYVKIVIITNRAERERAEETMERAYALIDSYESSFDYRGSDGELARFNAGTVLVKREHEQLFELLVQALDLAQLTGGFFDPTVLPLVELWGFDSVTGDPEVPDPEDILRALDQVGFDRVTVLEDRVVKPREVRLDLSGIAKGKIVDMTAETLLASGFSDFLVDAGGDIYVSGTNMSRNRWRIAIQDPVHRGQFSGVVERSDSAIVTSGDYEKFFLQDGRRYSHLFNPHTGYPDSDIRSVTVITGEAAVGDAVATAVFTMGREEGFLFLEEQGIEGLVLYEDQKGELRSLETASFWE